MRIPTCRARGGCTAAMARTGLVFAARFQALAGDPGLQAWRESVLKKGGELVDANTRIMART